MFIFEYSQTATDTLTHEKYMNNVLWTHNAKHFSVEWARACNAMRGCKIDVTLPKMEHKTVFPSRNIMIVH